MQPALRHGLRAAHCFCVYTLHFLLQPYFIRVLYGGLPYMRDLLYACSV